MILEILPDRPSAAVAIAEHVVSAIVTFQPNMYRKFVLGLPSGENVVGVYTELARLCRLQKVSFEYVVTINLTEYVGLAANHSNSCAVFMERELISQVDLPPAQTHCLYGQSPDTTYECARYESLITSFGGIHLMLIEVDEHGVMGGNEPGSSFSSRTRVVPTTQETRVAKAKEFDGVDNVPTQTLTMGVGTILEANEIIVLSAETKGLKGFLEGSVNHLCPASGLQLHPQVKVFTDQATASALSPKTTRDFRPTPPPDLFSPHLPALSPSTLSDDMPHPLDVSIRNAHVYARPGLTRSPSFDPIPEHPDRAEESMASMGDTDPNGMDGNKSVKGEAGDRGGVDEADENVVNIKVLKRKPGLRLITKGLPTSTITHNTTAAMGAIHQRGYPVLTHPYPGTVAGTGMITVDEGLETDDSEPGW